MNNPVQLSCGDVFERRTLKDHLKKKGQSSCPNCDQKISWEQVKAYNSEGNFLPQVDQKINQASQDRFSENLKSLPNSLAMISIPQPFAQVPRLIEQKETDPSNRIRECLRLIPNQFNRTLENLESFKKQKLDLLIEEMDSQELFQFLMIVISNLNIDKFCDYLNGMLTHLDMNNRKKICQSLMGINFVPTYSLARQVTANMFEIFFAQYDPLDVDTNDVEIDFFNYMISVARPLESYHFCAVFADKSSPEKLEQFIEQIVPQLEVENMDKLEQALISYKIAYKSEGLQQKLEKMLQKIIRLKSDKIQLQKKNIQDRRINRIWLFGSIAVAVAVAGIAYYYFTKNEALSNTLEEKKHALLMQQAVVENFAEALEKSNDTIDAMAKQIEQNAWQVGVLSQHLEEKSMIVNELSKTLAEQSAKLEHLANAETKQQLINYVENAKILTQYLPWIPIAIEVVKLSTTVLM